MREKYIRFFLVSIFIIFVFYGCTRSYDTEGLSGEAVEILASEAFENGHYHAASNLYTELLYRFPGETKTDYYLFMLANSEAGQRLWSDAEFYYRRLLNEHPRSPYTDETQLELARIFWQQKRDYRRDIAPLQNTLNELDIFFQNYPGSELYSEAELLRDSCYEQLAERSLFIGKFYARRELYDAALLYLREALSDYGENIWKADVYIAIADVYLDMGNTFTAKTYLEKAIEECDLTEGQLRRVEEIQSKL